MDMPKPGAEHKRLEVLVGSWVGEERIYPSPWEPKMSSAQGKVTARFDLDGFVVVTDYIEERGGKVSYRGHGVYGWDAKKQHYTMHWFDSMGGSPSAPGVGTWEGQRLTFQAYDPERGFHRYSYEFGDKRYRFVITHSKDGKDWQPMMEAAFMRVG
jgi:hypothetical protein